MLSITVGEGKNYPHAIIVKTDFSHKTLCKMIPGRAWNPSGRNWEYPLSFVGAQRILHAFKNICSDMPEIIKEYANRGETAKKIRTAILESTFDPLTVDYKYNGEPWRHQRLAYAWAMASNGGMLALEMGTGKTKVAIDIINNTLNHHNILIVCPKAVINVWLEQIPQHKLEHLRMAITAIRGGPKARLSAKLRMLNYSKVGMPGIDRNIVIINYDLIHNESVFKDILIMNPSMIIMDESHRIKGHKSLAFKACQKIARRADFRLCLTGTPIVNNCLDIWSQFNVIDPSILGNSFSAFDQRYMMPIPEMPHKKIPSNEEELNKIITKIAYRVKKEDVLDLPDTMDVIREFEMDAKSRRFYESVRHELTIDLNILAEKGEEDSEGIRFATTAINKAQQICNGFMYYNDETIDIHNGKIELLQQVIDEIDLNVRNVAVFAKFQEDVARINKAFPNAYVLAGNRDDYLEFKKQDKGAIFLSQFKKGGTGIDLTNCHYLIYYSCDFNWGDYEQGRSRIHRSGQKYKCTYIHLHAKNGMDGYILRSLNDKTPIINYLLTHKKEFEL